MPDWLSASLSGGPGTSPPILAWRIGIALVLGIAVSALYRWARRDESVPPTFGATLVLLSTLIAMATQVIGDNVARAFSLVGALSVVRFRTVVKDTQDTAFVIFAVVVGMASGANVLAVALVGLAVIGGASLVLWPPGRRAGGPPSEGRLTFRVGLAQDVRIGAEAILSASVDRCDLLSVGTARQGSCLDLAYRVRLRHGSSPAGLVTELSRLEGVENIELRRDD